MSQYRWGFLGTGRVTNRMALAISQSQSSALSAVASRDMARAQEWIAAQAATHACEADHVQAFGSYQELIDSPKVDWIYNALPPSLHFSWSAAAMKAGKHVLCEKPLCLTLEEADALRAISESTGRRLVHATAFPHHPRSMAAQEVVRSSELGDIRRVIMACSFSDAFRRDSDHRVDPMLGGGCLLDLGWYCVMATTWLTGLRVDSVSAIGRKRSGVWESVQVLAVLSNGAVAHWDCGFDSATRKWIEVAGTDGSWICDDFLRPWDLAKPRYWIHGHAGKSRSEMIGENSFQEVALIDACCGGTEEWIRSQLDEAVETHRVLDMIDRKARE